MKNNKRSKVLNPIAASKAQVNSVTRAQKRRCTIESEDKKLNSTLELTVLLEATAELPSVGAKLHESDDSDKENGLASPTSEPAVAGEDDGEDAPAPSLSAPPPDPRPSEPPTEESPAETPSQVSPLGDGVSCPSPQPAAARSRSANGRYMKRTKASPVMAPPPTVKPAGAAAAAAADIPSNVKPAVAVPAAPATPTDTANSDASESVAATVTAPSPTPAPATSPSPVPATSPAPAPTPALTPVPPTAATTTPAADTESDLPASGPGAVRLSPVSKYGRVRRARSDAAYVSTDRTYAALTGQDMAPARLQAPSGARRRAAELRRSLAAPTEGALAEVAGTAGTDTAAVKNTVSGFRLCQFVTVLIDTYSFRLSQFVTVLIGTYSLT